MKYRMVSPVSSGTLPASFMTHCVDSPSSVSLICWQSHSFTLQLIPCTRTSNALPSPMLTRYPRMTGLIPARLKSGNRLVSLSRPKYMNVGSASGCHLYSCPSVMADMNRAPAAMGSMFIDSSFLRSFFLGLVCAISSLRRGKEPFLTVLPMEVW